MAAYVSITDLQTFFSRLLFQGETCASRGWLSFPPRHASTCYRPYHFTKMARAPGFEPGNGRSKVYCLTAWPRPIIIDLQNRRHVEIISWHKGIDKMLLH